MKKLLISIYILSVMLMLSGCKEEVEYEFLHEQSRINRIEIIRVGEEEQGANGPELLYTVEDVNAFMDDFEELDCYVMYGDPRGINPRDLVVKVSYMNGDYELIGRSGQIYRTSEGGQYDYICFPKEEFNDFLAPYLRKSLGASIEKNDLAE